MYNFRVLTLDYHTELEGKILFLKIAHTSFIWLEGIK